MSPGRRIVLDCRWLAVGGTGRLTELLLRGLAEVRPPGTWVLWGPPAVQRWAWAGSQVVITPDDPRATFGQRSWLRLPAHDLVVFMHQKRPLRPGPSVTLVLDTIPLRFASSALDRRSKALFLQAVGRLSDHILTISDYSRACIQRDLRVPRERISVLRLPVDTAHAESVHRLRADVKATDTALYVGNFAAHKNLPRLIEAFGGTEFCRAGGQLALVGGGAGELQALSATLTETQRSSVRLHGRCTQHQLDRHYAGALFLVQPSLEEGFGLPAWEALACGLPVCASDGGALPEVLEGLVEVFPATSTQAMTRALDACAERAQLLRAEGGPVPSEALAARAPDLRGFAEQVVAVVQRTLA